MQSLYEKYKDRGLEILAFPCNQFGSQEPGTNEQIEKFAKDNFNVTFRMFSKIDVNGSKAEPLWQWLQVAASGTLTDSIKWNFTKFLLDKEGKPVKRLAPKDEPDSLIPEIEKLLN